MTDNRLLFDNLFYIMNNIFKGNEIIYISTPINTGERYIKWFNSNGKNFDVNSVEYNEELRKNVINPNIENAKKRIENIRRTTNKIVVDPTILENEILNWTQDDYYRFWSMFIKDLVKEIVLLDGWEYSLGCCYEFLTAIESNILIYTQDMRKLSINEALLKLNKSTEIYSFCNLKIVNKIEEIKNIITEKYYNYQIDKSLEMKDDKLHYLVNNNISNIAQFVSFEPSLKLTPKYIHINNFYNKNDLSASEIIEKLISSSLSKSVNIRSFSPEVMKGNSLVFNKTFKDIDEILKILAENNSKGKHTIINENISIYDSGVSGVVLGDIIEFSPEDTPKCVDKEGVCSLPRWLGMNVLYKVYGFVPSLNFDSNCRVEFSIHPSKQGVNKDHTIIWEYEYYSEVNSEIKITWPNRFSKFLGDKVFGLLIADTLGLKVPRTMVISRKVAPFTFGIDTGQKEKWIRTCPIIKEPGKYFTGFNWTDPFKLMEIEEAKGNQDINIASIISQDAVEAVYSGASIIRNKIDDDIIEGVEGKGDKFMVGEQNRENLPQKVVNMVRNLNNQLRMYHKVMGDVSIEWVYDGMNVWVVQLNQIKLHLDSNKSDSIIVPGNPNYYEKVYVNDGLDSLREKIQLYKNKGVGIELIGNIGVTSHFGDLLRLYNIPSIITSI